MRPYDMDLEQCSEAIRAISGATAALVRLEALEREALDAREEGDVCPRPSPERLAEIRAEDALLGAPGIEGLGGRLRERRELLAEIDALRAALEDVVSAMEIWGAWEDGVPSSDNAGEMGRVGKAYDRARALLGCTNGRKQPARKEE